MITIPARGSIPAAQIYVAPTEKRKLPLFLLPGGPGCNSSHFESYRCLQDHIGLVFYDPRGCGDSDKTDPCHYSLDTYIEDIEAIRKSFGYEKIALLGKSYSGLCALGYALRYPERIEKLALVATGPSHAFISTAKKKLSLIGSPEQIQASEKLWEGTFTSDEEVDAYFSIMMPLYSTKQAPASSGDVKPVAFEPMNQGFLTDLRTVDFTEDLYKIRCPTLVITGDSDWIFDQHYSELMAEKIPNSELVILKNAGHFVETDAPDEFYTNLRAWFCR